MHLTKLISALSCAAVLALTPAMGQASLLGDIQGSFYTNGAFGNWNNAATDQTFQSGVTGTSNGSGPVGNVFWTEANNIGPGHTNGVPSGGEPYDLEFLAWRINVQTNKFEVLAVSSVNPQSGIAYGSRFFHTGDVFMELDGDDTTGFKGTGVEGWDAALSSGPRTTAGDGQDSLHAGAADLDYTLSLAAGLYQVNGVNDIHGIATGGTSGYGTGYGIVLPALNNPFALRGTPALLASATVTYTTLFPTEGGRTNYATEWTMDRADLERLLPSAIGGGPDYSNLKLHWTMGCGNDYIDTEEPGDRDPIIPEPATLALLGLGLGTLGFVRRRR